MNTLIMTIGLPRSGKSTWAQTQGLPIVNPDSIRLAIHGQPFIPSAEGLVWAIAKLMVHALFLAGHPKVILDATNASKGRRDEWKSPTWKRQFVPFASHVDVLISRAKKDGREDLIPVIERMLEKMDWRLEEE